MLTVWAFSIYKHLSRGIKSYVIAFFIGGSTIGEYGLFNYLISRSGFIAQILVCSTAGLKTEASASKHWGYGCVTMPSSTFPQCVGTVSTEQVLERAKQKVMVK